ncbi:MAG: hypothetical protein ACRBI6_12180 [Acidimicrobiales bacterium]
MKVLAATIAIVTLTAGGWTWYRNQPDPTWLCESDSAMPCAVDITLDVDAVSDRALVGDARVIEVDVSAASGPIAGTVRADEHAALALFDARTGEVTRTLLPLTKGWVSTPRFSPDGSLVAAVHQGWTAGTAGAVVEIFDTATGESVAVHPFGEAGFDCAGRLGISPDNLEFQCQGTVRHLLTGDLIEHLTDEENRWAGSGFGRWAWAASGRTYDRDRGSDEILLLEQIDGERQVVETLPAPDVEIALQADSAFTDSGEPPRLALLGSREAGGWTERWRRAERSFPLGSLGVANGAGDVASAHLGFTPAEVGWTADDSLVWLLGTDARLVVVDPGR